MANKENDKWIIEIRDGEDGETSSKKKKTPLNTLQRIIANPGQLLKSSLIDSAEDLYKKHKIMGLMAGIGIQAASKFSEIVENSAEAAASRYCTLQEDYLTQQTVNNVKGSINRLKSGANSVISGAASMAGFGPIGMAAGAAMGAVSFGINQYTEYQKRMSNYYQQLNSANFQTGFTASRMGLSNNGRGTEN